MSNVPQRIVSLSAEAADWLWRIGAWPRVVGVTACFTPPREAPSKPRVGGFSSARLDDVLVLRPDLVVTFSDVQSGVAAALVHRGVPVLALNQRTLAETEAALAMLARSVGCEEAGEACLREFRQRLAPVKHPASRPRVYFEEWPEPLITGIAWVGELVERAGGVDVFAGLRECRSAPERVVSPEQVRLTAPEVVLASWCGKPVDSKAFGERPGWAELPALRAGQVFELPGEDILQAGFRLVYGYERIKRCLGTGNLGS